MSDATRLKATVYVGGLDNAVTAETLHAAFIPFGDIADISLPKPELPSSNDPHRGFGYVEFEQAEDAKEAMDNMDQSELFGRVIKVAPAKPQKDSTEGLGSKTAVWQQEGWLAQHGVSEEDRQPVGDGDADGPLDPMQGLEGLDVAGPKPE
ncbi:putative peptidyl prolyl cis-trans isomerase cyclophilin [Venturia nashicola]|uniref:Putative peptidyl prolyl cis-trans isomerase cyclophilin n=1 Tax=Venturia nashicola TaxID=86259 RepID=A0A4Z1PGI4_9PEZI|nr:putative peptidyl prolyl cis-trans isomerase cyclophilin [Venturia nashicola]TLD36928.1 putative peptidyl prolyl cis-trans isomerase cyclophilin [Venturia nashicola]